MTFPADRTMLLLFALCSGARLGVDDDRLTVEIDSFDGPLALDGLDQALGDLEDRGWIVHEESGPVVTEQGRYAVRRFVRRKRVGART